MSSDPDGKNNVQEPAIRPSEEVGVADTLPQAMTGRASPAKAAVGDKPVYAYIASLPQPQRGIAETVDALAAKTLPDLRCSVKRGMSYYGVAMGGASVAAASSATSSSCISRARRSSRYHRLRRSGWARQHEVWSSCP